MMLIKLQRSATHAFLGFVVSFAILLIQLTGNGRALASSLREYSLIAVGQVEELLIPLKRISIWLSSKTELEKKILYYEIKSREMDALQSKYFSLEKEYEDLKTSFDQVDQKQWIGASLLTSGNKFLIDKGSEDGIKEHAIVLFHGSIFGIVDRVESRISRLRTIFDSDFRLGVRVENQVDTVGVMNSKRGKLVVSTISRSETVKVGDKVVTIGDENIQKAGILVGFVEQILTRSADPVSTFVIKPLVNPREARAVVVSK